VTIKHNVTAIQRLLAEHPDGLTISEIADLSGLDIQVLHNATRYMRDVYVDRWVLNKLKNQWVMVYCLMVKPATPPRPTIKPSAYLREQVAA
jgi:hypothetical protein